LWFKERERKFLNYLNKVDSSLIDQVTLNQHSFIRIYKYWLESSTIKVLYDDSEHPFLFDIIRNENLDIHFKRELLKLEYMLRLHHFIRAYSQNTKTNIFISNGSVLKKQLKLEKN